MERFFPPSDAEAAQREIKETIRRHADGLKKAAPEQGSTQGAAAGFSALRDATRLVKISEALVGNMPPEPPTFRGRAGAWIIRKIRRALFWYTPAILEFHRNVTRAAEQQVAVIEELLRDQAALRSRANELERSLKQEILKESATRAALEAWVGSEITFAHKKFAEIEADIQQARQDALERLRDDLIARIEQARDDAVAKTEQAQSRGLKELRNDLLERIEQERSRIVEETEKAQQHLAAKLDQERSHWAGMLEARLLAERARRDAELAGEREAARERIRAEICRLDEKIRHETEAERARRDAELADERDAARERIRAEICRLDEKIRHETEAVLGQVRPVLEQQALASEQTLGAARNDFMRALKVEAGAREAVGAEIIATERRMDNIEGRMGHAERKLLSASDGLRSQEMRLSVVLEQTRKRLNGMSASQLSLLVQEDAHKLDAIYLTFEDQFRGSRQDIKERLRVYLPLLKEHGIGTPEMPVLDVGCGRGEWLELLREEALQAQGVDSNRAMLARCVEQDLKTTESDAIEHLRGLDPESLGGVTGFHIIEHLPFQRLLDLMDETVRVLKPGGVAIFETPNPSNVLVGTERFYFDPTHRNPLPSPLTRFLAEERGLCRVEVLELHAWPEAHRVRGDNSAVAERFNRLFYGPQDYAIIGWKV